MIRTVLLILVLFSASMLFAQPLTREERANTESFITNLLEKMTLDEKAGQLCQYTAYWGENGQFLNPDYEKYIEQGYVGSFLNAIQPDFVERVQRMAMEKSRMKIPILFGFDVIHGFRTIFPIPLGEAASWDIELIEKTARIAASEASAVGIHWTFAPMVDIARDPRWGRIAEGSGEDTYLGSQIAIARVRGFQGQDISENDTILACAKHFAAYGAAEAGRDYNTVDMSEQKLREVYLPPFEAATKAGAKTFMTSFNEIAGVPSTGNPKLLNEILRKEWKFDGFVVSDYTAINEMILHGYAQDEPDAGRLAILAGTDMDMEGHIYRKHLVKLVQDGLVSEKVLDESVRRILRLKYELGLFKNPFYYCDSSRPQQRIMTKENLAQALKMAQESIVLLKNENNLLPLAKNVKTLAVIGPMADNQVDMMGCWWGAGDAKDVVTLLKGIQTFVSPETQVLFSKGCGAGLDDTDTQGFAEALSIAEKSDVIIACFGETAAQSGEAASRSNLDLPGMQENLLKELAKTGKPIVLVLTNGRPLTIPWANQNIPAILECWQLGTQAGLAVASVLFGDVSPSGKLPITFPRSLGQIPVYYNAKNTGRPMLDPNTKYCSRYLDIPNTPLYPFGYGLSYTNFVYSDLILNKEVITTNEDLQVSITLTNAGKKVGTEVVQLYIRDEVASVTRPVKELRRFQRITLEPGAKQIITFTLSPNDFHFYNNNLDYVLEPGNFQILVGGNSQDVISVKFQIK